MYLKELAAEVNIPHARLKQEWVKGVLKGKEDANGIKLDQEEIDFIRHMSSLPKLTDFVTRGDKKYASLQNLCKTGKLHSVMFMGRYRLYMDSVEVVKRMILWRSSKDVRVKLGISPNSLNTMIYNGYVDATKIFGMYYFDRYNFIKLREYKNGLTKHAYMKKYNVNCHKLELMLDDLETFKFGERIMIKDVK